MTVSEKLRLVQGLHSHAEIFGFKWDDDSDWTWHDVACKIADEVDVENAKLWELGEQYETVLADYRSEVVKLRELVRDLWEACPADGYYCIYHCKHYDKESESHCKLEDRMRELGVEVD